MAKSFIMVVRSVA
jgi:hypothetical protein